MSSHKRPCVLTVRVWAAIGIALAISIQLGIAVAFVAWALQR